MLESGPPDQVGPAAAAVALLPEGLMVSAEAPVRAPGVGEQSVGLRGKVPVLSRPRMGRRHRG